MKTTICYKYLTPPGSNMNNPQPTQEREQSQTCLGYAERQGGKSKLMKRSDWGRKTNQNENNNLPDASDLEEVECL